jgi:hypothetical protein
LLTLFEAYCTDVDKSSHDEAAEWRTEFTASMGELEAASKQGTDEVLKRAAEYAAKAKEYADAAEATAKAMKPGAINITIETTKEGTTAILLDDNEVAKGVGKAFVIPSLPVGRHKIAAQLTTADGKMVEASQVLDTTSEVKPVTLKL